jgi:hypothetical protein|tara:strand:- start:9100 stop:9300 length:201 start_codon:yes stop_codon:yes gene_type:complete
MKFLCHDDRSQLREVPEPADRSIRQKSAHYYECPVCGEEYRAYHTPPVILVKTSEVMPYLKALGPE